MPRIDLPEDYAVSLLRQSVRDSLMSHGEESILLHMYRASADEGKVPRCVVCFNDVYNQSEDQMCNVCWGTTFQGGVKIAARAWTLFTDSDTQEELQGKHGVYNPDQRQVQVEYPPELSERDYIVRVSKWEVSGVPLEVEGFYFLGKVDPTSLRTGNRFGQSTHDFVGQTSPITRLSESHVITKYPVVGQYFSRLDGRVR